MKFSALSIVLCVMGLVNLDIRPPSACVVRFIFKVATYFIRPPPPMKKKKVNVRVKQRIFNLDNLW